jgi:type I restriction enzyme, S subunit
VNDYMSSVEAITGKCSLLETRKYVDVKKGYTSFIDGDLIFAKITPCMENGKIALLEKLTNGVGFGSTEFHVSRFSNLINRRFFFYYFNQEVFRQNAKKNMTGSAGQLRVSKTYFEEIKIPLPPFLEQNRIIEKIEELFSDLDVGIENLKTARSQLKIYRQSVLKWAFEGKLTADWRQEQQRLGKLQSAEELLAQIKVERENRYQQQVKDWEKSIDVWEVNGKVAKKPTKPQKYKIVELPNDADVVKSPELPKGWCYVQFGELIIEGPQNGLYKSASYYGEGTLIIRIDSFYDGRLNSWETFKRLVVDGDELDVYQVNDGDILVNRVNSMTHLGKCSLVKNIPEKCVFESNIMRLKILSCLFDPLFVTCYLSSVEGLKQLRKNAKQAVNQASINQVDVICSLIPVCSIEEQYQIIQQIESRLSICDNLEATIEENLQRAESLRQSILKQAFTGKLVPQDPNDEPAAQLLARIQQEQSAQQPLLLKPRKPGKKTP